MYYIYLTIVHHPDFGCYYYVGKTTRPSGYHGSCKLPIWKQWLSKHPEWFQTRILQQFDNPIDQGRAEVSLILKCLQKYGSFLKDIPMPDGSKREWLSQFSSGRCLNGHWQNCEHLHSRECVMKAVQSRYTRGFCDGRSHDPNFRKTYIVNYYKAHRDSITEKNHRYYEINRDVLLEKAKQYRESHKEEIAAYKESHYVTNRDALLDKAAAYRESHKEEIAAYKEAYYAENRDMLLEKAKQYRESHKEEIAAYKESHRLQSREDAKAYYDAHRQEILLKKKAIGAKLWTNGVDVLPWSTLHSRINRGTEKKADWVVVQED